MAGNFNPRLREGGDKFAGTLYKFFINFNPRLREGGDYKELERLGADVISIHASAREATALSLVGNCSKSFQSTPPRGRRLEAKDKITPVLHFNPRLREGGDTFASLFVPAFSSFQSTPPRGRRRRCTFVSA